ncbi:MAG: sulfatase-like hydrolase/transferase [Planctomycetota bacterium]
MSGDDSRRGFLTRSAGGLLAGVAARLAAAPAGQRPNVLWIISEDTGPEFGCYGYPLVHTPNVDRLAREGALFTNAFTTTPVCSTSRSSFMTGMYATTIDAHHHRSHRRDGYQLPEGIHVFTKYLRDAGYFTALCGKGKTDWNFKPKVKPYDSHRWEDLKAHQPFFAQYQFSETHRRFKRCKEHPVDPDEVTLPPYYPDHPVARKDWALYLETVNVLDQKIGALLERLERDGLAENTIVFYFGDHGRAHVRGKQWLYDGGIHIPLVVRWPGHIEAGTRVEELVSALSFAPTVLDLAGAPVPGHMQGRIVLGPRKQPEPDYVFATRDRCDETMDRIRCVRSRRYKYIRNFMPERPYTQLNRYKERSYPMLPLMRKLHAEGKLNAVQERFMADRRPPEELYDVQADPWEVHNLADSPEHQDVLETLRQRLDRWIEETDDKGETPEDPEVQKHYEDRMKRAYDRKRKPTGGAGKRLPEQGLLDRKGWRIHSVSSQETKAQPQAAANVLDGDPMTCWHTQWKAARPGFPHELVLDLGARRTVRGLRYLPRQDRAQNGRLRKVEVYVSDDAETWGQPVAAGTFENSLDEQQLTFQPVQARYLRLLARSGYSGPFAAVAELNLLGE